MPLFAHLEFHRSGIGLVAPAGAGADSALYVARLPGGGKPLRSCTCAASKKKTCAHLLDLSRAVTEVERTFGGTGWEEVFAATLWHRLARLLFGADPRPCSAVRAERIARAGGAAVRVDSAAGGELAWYVADAAAQTRLLERLGKAAGAGGAFDRAGMIERLALFQATAEERHFNKAGMRTNRQAWEESVWQRLAYHCVREHESEPGSAGTFHPAIDEATGAFTLGYRVAGVPVAQVAVPRAAVADALRLLAAEFPDQAGLAIRPIPLASIFHVAEETELDMVEVRPVIRALQEDGEARFFAQPDLAKFRYGNLVYVKELGVLAELERPGKERRFRAPVRMTLERCQVPTFLEEHREELGAGLVVLDEPLARRRVFKSYDRVEIDAGAIERSWYWLSVQYGFGTESISLAALLAAKRAGLPYLETPGGWIDLNAPALAHLEDLLERQDEATGDRVRLSASELLRLRATAEAPVAVGGDAARAAVLTRLFDLRPAAPFRPPRGLASTLRPYQTIGVDWLRFLWENRLAGLLSDDMGLGKTHQAMALMVSLHEAGEVAAPCLVVCPTSVVPHWRAKLREHAPGLRATLYHGAQRSVPGLLGPGDVLVTSYGVLRRDAEELARRPFAVAVFDEVQHLKNRGTLGYQAAARLEAEMKLGLTGTPIENSLADLKALFDLLLPGYLGSDATFVERYVRPADAMDRRGEGEDQLPELRRLISPFVLRRLKSAVLDELPEKIDDLRTCALSDDQVKLYRDAIGGRGAELKAQIEAAAEPLPYIHVFALLNLLKRICDHPALALGQLDRADDYASGKWDLFREILEECLGSGQKVVVFTQYLGMIALMERHLTALGVGYATLTGGSGTTARRGEIVDRFNCEPGCRVFLGSLKAGGTGIDLVGGSVVIHYDRWWNAAREDQATDRVHRIGQRRAVQVVKLVTEGTLEEKIGAIIERKRRVMDSVVQADDPALAKIFTREELLELLRPV